jgi:hypothetical protein
MNKDDTSRRLAKYGLKSLEGASRDIVLEASQSVTLDEVTFRAHCAPLRPSSLAELQKWIGAPADVVPGKEDQRPRKAKQRVLKGKQERAIGDRWPFLQPPPAHLKPDMDVAKCSREDRQLLADAARQFVYRTHIHPQFLDLAESWFRAFPPEILGVFARDLYVSSGSRLEIAKKVVLLSFRNVYVEPGGLISKLGADFRLNCEVFSGLGPSRLPTSTIPRFP